MDGHRWHDIKRILGQAMEQPPADRQAFVAQACGGDADLRAAVQELIDADDQAGDFLASPTVDDRGRGDAIQTGVIDATAGAPMPPRDAVPGFDLVRELGRGGQAVVYLAVQKSTGRKVAVKVLREGPFASERERARFDREVQILAALEHPNIVAVIDRGVTASGADFLAMPYVAGLPLDQWLTDRRAANGGDLPDPAVALRLFMKICDAVNAAHLRGIVHRDLKPGNIRIDADGEPHILDFGLARAGFDGGATATADEESRQPVTITGQFMGSLPWASPEQAEGLSSKIDVRSDVYSLGVILYQMLTDRFPYEVVGNMRDVLNNILTVKPTPPSAVLASRAATARARAYEKGKRPPKRRAATVNEQVEAIVLKALSKRRDDRYLSAGEFGRDVGNYLSGQPTVAAGMSRQHARRRRWRAIAALALVASVIVGVTLSVIRWRDDRTPAAAGTRPAYGGDRSTVSAVRPNDPTIVRPGDVILVDVIGSTRGAVWGTDVYSDDSDLSAAAVHAGLLKDGERGTIVVAFLPGRDAYEGSKRNGVASRSYGRWPLSYALSPGPSMPHGDPGPASPLIAYRGRVGEVVALTVTGAAAGFVYGSGVYSDDSSVATAAVHAGLLRPGETRELRVRILPGRTRYDGTVRNNVTSFPWDAWPGSFEFVTEAIPTTTPTTRPSAHGEH